MGRQLILAELRNVFHDLTFFIQVETANIFSWNFFERRLCFLNKAVLMKRDQFFLSEIRLRAHRV